VIASAFDGQRFALVAGSLPAEPTAEHKDGNSDFIDLE
jgi:hypothetical protein